MVLADQPPSLDSLIQGYFAAYNSDDPQKMREFLQTNFVQGTSIDDQLKMYQASWQETGALQIQKLMIRGGDAQVQAASQKGGLLSFTFQFQNGKIAALQVDTNSHQREPKKNEAEFIQAFTDYLKQASSADEFSGVVVVAKDYKPIFQQAYGLANKSFQQPNRLDTRFNLGSINKLFTRIAIGQLVEQKKLSLNDKLIDVYPDYPNREVATKITIQQIIDMQSGLGDFFNDKYDNTPKNRLRELKDWVPLFVNDPLNFEPGTQRKYSNAGYLVLGLLIERLSGENYYDYVQKHIFDIAGMTHSGYYEADVPTENLAEGYTSRDCADDAKDCARRSNIYSRPARGNSAGGGYSTAEDLLKFVQAMKGNKLIAADNPLSFTKEDVGFAGGAEGINASVETNRNYTLIALSNYDPPSAEQIAEKFNSWLPQ